MKPRSLTIALSWFLLAPGCAHRSAAFGYSFDEISLGGVPESWEVAETNGRGTPGKWAVVEADAGRRCMRLVETANSGQTYNLLLLPDAYAADLDLSVAVRAEAGREDQGGGLVWRARDRDNYYITRWNPLENNLRAYKVVGGKRTQLASARVDVPAQAWHELAVHTRGSRIVVKLDGRELLDFADVTFGKGGRIGLWTKADAATSFDDLQVVCEVQ